LLRPCAFSTCITSSGSSAGRESARCRNTSEYEPERRRGRARGCWRTTERREEEKRKRRRRKKEIRREQHQTNSRWLLGLNAFPGIGSIYRVSRKSRVNLLTISASVRIRRDDSLIRHFEINR
jgi:hypothetical protein